MGVLLAGGLPGLLNQSSAQVIDGSVKFGSGYLTRTPSSNGNRTTWTWSCWVKRNIFDSTRQTLFRCNSNNENHISIAESAQGNAEAIIIYGASNGPYSVTSAVLRDPSAWYHITLTVDTTLAAEDGRYKVYINGALQTSYSSRTNPNEDYTGGINSNASHSIGANPSGGEPWKGSISQVTFIDGQALGPGYFGFTDPLTGTWRPKKVRQGDTSPVNDGTIWSSGTKTTTGSGLYSGSWDKVFDGNLNIGVANGAVYVYNNSSATLTFPKPLTGYISVFGSNGSNSATDSAGTDQIVLSDGSIFDVSGLDVPDSKWYNFGYKENITSIRAEHNAGSGQGTFLRAIAVNGVELLDNDTSSVDFGTNGFYLPMDNDDFHIDKSGKGNDWTKQSFSGTFNDPDVLKDSPSGAVSGGRAQTGITTTSSAPSNYATLNPLQRSLNRTPTLSDGNLTVSLSSGSSEWTNTGCTMNIGSGKYYWEVQFTTINGTIARIGVADSDDYEFNRNTSGTGLPWMGSGTGKSWSLDVGGNTLHNGSTVNASYTSTIITSDIIGVLLDLDNNTLSYSKNGTNLGVAHSNVTSDFVTPGFGLHGATTNTINVNFGQKPFKFPPPAGYKLLNAADLRPETVITRPDQYVGAKTFAIPTGGSGGSFTTDNDFDMIWTKNRTNSGKNHVLQDSVRGYGDNKSLHPNLTVAQTSTNNIMSVSGRTVTIGSNDNYYDNNVAWSWKAGGSKGVFNVDDVGYASAAAAGLTGGTITPTGSSVGTKQGFSIIGFTDGGSACSIPHGLTKAPDFYIAKFIGASGNWSIYHKSLGNTKRLKFTTDNSGSADAGWWQNTSPTSSLFYLGGNLITSTTQIAYLWHDVPGLQKFGSYVGNGNADGVFIETGFRPTLIWIKDTTNNGESWNIHDTARVPINPNSTRLIIDGNAAEATNAVFAVDMLSNGFKFRTGNDSHNQSSRTYIYCAWAEAPTFNLYGGQSNAR